MFEKILFPTDFSEVSLYALRECIPKLFEKGAKKLYLLHVVDITATDIQAIELAKIDEEEVRKLAEELRAKGIDVEPVVKLGIPSMEIEELAREKNIDLTVIPSKGENIWRQMFLGSTASNLARTTKKPVLLVKCDIMDGEVRFSVPPARLFEKPLIALDFSKCSDNIIKTVKKFEELPVSGILLHSVDYGRVDELEGNIKKAKDTLDKYSKMLPFEVEREIMIGLASKAILGVSLTKNATLIVMGKKGRNVLADLLLGSTAERVIRDSKLPVLLVPCD
ncbi:universal stress protein [Thermococcus sp.]